jgi:hypothetical protein
LALLVLFSISITCKECWGCGSWAYGYFCHHLCSLQALILNVAWHEMLLHIPSLRLLPFWDIIQCSLVVVYWCFNRLFWNVCKQLAVCAA